MRGRLIGAFALLSISVSQPVTATEQYATADEWEITTNGGACMMMRSYVLASRGDEQALVLYYDAERKGAVLGWGTQKPKLPPLSTSLDFEISFSRAGPDLDESWGSQSFQIEKHADGYRFSHMFNGPTDSERILRDFASSSTFALWLGPTLIMSLPLVAKEAVAKLRECSSKRLQQEPSDDSHR